MANFDAQSFVAQQEQEQKKQEQQAAQEESRQSMLLAVLSGDARQRLGRISTVKPDKARQIENLVLAAVQRGQMQPPISEQTLISILEQLSERQSEGRATTITVKRKVDEDDDW
eukprot:NODE_7482_length_472_cov_10.229314_g7038_i0.p1 GENE.NODE_7482_length_472_cov_10.229314_g7038_i0~~NODE_7482_length_472_cov_10.229314_g7038_i0.p1  ORF type:complete len:114 (+),score=25.64 NODE_7482_length_472_cov_10.229314_g7038_i0:41-382(+)